MSLFGKARREYEEHKQEIMQSMMYMNNRFAGLVDPETRRVIYFTSFIYVGRCFQELRQGLKLVLNIGRRFPGPINTAIQPWFYRWCQTTQMLVYDPSLENVDPSYIAEFELINEKCFAVEVLLHKIEFSQLQLYRGSLPYQGEIYRVKAEQAHKYLAGDTEYLNTYFVHDYAELKQIPVEQAAKQIIFQAEGDIMYLSGIENLRLKFTDKILKAEKMDDIFLALKQFETESYVNASV